MNSCSRESLKKVFRTVLRSRLLEGLKKMFATVLHASRRVITTVLNASRSNAISLREKRKFENYKSTSPNLFKSSSSQTVCRAVTGLGLCCMCGSRGTPYKVDVVYENIWLLAFVLSNKLLDLAFQLDDTDFVLFSYSGFCQATDWAALLLALLIVFPIWQLCKSRPSSTQQHEMQKKKKKKKKKHWHSLYKQSSDWFLVMTTILHFLIR